MAHSAYLLNEPLLSTEQLTGADDDEIIATIQALTAEQIRRALDEADPAAVAEAAFEGEAFDYKGMPVAPYLFKGLLVCPGVKSEKSKTSHDCIFVSIGSDWVWDHAEAVFDDMRQLPGQKVVRRGITILPAYEGLEYDVVTSQARGGGRCQMKSVRSFAVRGGRLVETKARTKAENTHR
jgi:hypothetical protein